MSARNRAYLMLLLVAVIWGFASPIIKHAFLYLSPELFLTYRFFLSALIMLPILFITEPHLWHTLSALSGKEWFYLLIGGLLGSIGQLYPLFLGLAKTSSIDASVINSVSPIFVSIAGFYFLHERITRRERIGLSIAFIGSLIVVIQPATPGNLWGNILVFSGTFAWVAYIILTKHELRLKLSPFFLTAFMFVVGFFGMSIITIFKTQPWQIAKTLTSLPLSAHLAVIYMAVFSGTIAYWLYQKGQKTIEASEANIFSYLSPVFSAPLAFFWLKEPITLSLVIGSAIIALGVALAQFKPHCR